MPTPAGMDVLFLTQTYPRTAEDTSGPFIRELARALVRGGDRVRVLAPHAAGLAAQVGALGFPAARARVIPYGVDATLFRPDGSRRQLWRQRLGIPADAPLVLGLGRMATKKGFQVLLRELPALFAAVPDAHVVLAGAGDLLAGFRRETAAL